SRRRALKTTRERSAHVAAQSRHAAPPQSLAPDRTLKNTPTQAHTSRDGRTLALADGAAKRDESPHAAVENAARRRAPPDAVKVRQRDAHARVEAARRHGRRRRRRRRTP